MSSYVNAIGFVAGATLVVSERGNTVTAELTDDNGNASSLDFTPTTHTSAILGRSGGTVSGFWNQCTTAPENAMLHPVSLGASAGALTYDDGTIFLTMNGTLQGDPTICGAEPAPASFWVVCDERAGGAPPPEPSQGLAVGSAPLSLAGSYSCSSQVGGYAEVNRNSESSFSVGEGTLTLIQSGAELTAEYSGDALVASALHLTTTTATTASAEANQSVLVLCPAVAGTPSAPQLPATLPLTASSLAMVGSTLFVSFAGATDASSSCPNTILAGSLLCTK